MRAPVRALAHAFAWAGLVVLVATAAPAEERAPAEPPGAGAPLAPSGWPSRGRLGVEVMPMTPELRSYFQAPGDRGLLVVRVASGRPAERAGLQVGDVLLTVSGEPLERPHDLVAMIARARADQKLVVELVRGRETRTLEVTPDGEPIPDEAIEAWHGLGRMGEHLMRGMHEGTAEVLRRLDEIERRLERIEGEGERPR